MAYWVLLTLAYNSRMPIADTASVTICGGVDFLDLGTASNVVGVGILVVGHFQSTKAFPFLNRSSLNFSY